MNKSTYVFVCFLLCFSVSSVFGQGFGYPTQNVVHGEQAVTVNSQSVPSRDLMDTRNFRLIEYRRMFMNGVTPAPEELVGYWRGVNKGVVELVGYKQFVKEILPNGACISGDNIKVGQVNNSMLRCMGWQPKIDPQTGTPERNGKFAISGPNGRGAFGHGVVFNYRQGGNRKTDPANLLIDKVVKIDQNHMLGRVTAKFGPLQIPLAYFVLERIQ